MQRLSRRREARLCAAAFAIATLASSNARASLFTGDTLDSVANGIAWAVLVLVPIIGIVVFWLVHVLPEKIAERRHHPQTAAITTLCLLSLVFGGLLWPIAWLWAFTKPVMHKMAYGTDKHEDYFDEVGEKARAGELVEHDLATLKRELDEMHARGALPAKLIKLREDLASLQSAPGAVQSAAAERRSA
jgi:CBS domain containing-hemolysin-like protein